jgi:hypothetical protein
LRNVYGAFASGGTCPASSNASTLDSGGVNPANVVTDNAGRSYLKSAIEILDPWFNPSGNYNGLCESGEGCLYTPNLGAYQGNGDFSANTCTGFVGGNGVTGVTLYAYPVNGV